ncbi:sulfatase-like hydrolase/transferase [Phycisphaeraceae bacterium D3-23]
MISKLPMFVLVLAMAFVCSSPAEAQDASPPNIIWIVSDDCGYNDFSMHGSDTPTPRIDSIATNGVRFTDGYVSGCVCSPSRAGLLTGRYQQTFGHEFNIPPRYSETNGLPLTETLMPAVLQDAGYRTIAMGKWHLGYAPKFHPMERGFTDYYGFLQGQRSYFPIESPTRLNRILRDREVVLPEDFEYMTDHLGDEAARYIEDSKDGPFFIYLAFNATHGPFHTTDEDLAAANGDKVAAMTIALDRAVGKVLDALSEHGLTDNTMVVFINDNGGTPRHDNRPLNGNKGSCWEGGMRVPFVMQWPAVMPAGQVSDAPVIALDLFPTAMAAAGIGESTGEALHGVDLVPFLTGDAEGRPRQTLYWKNGDAWAVRDGDLKLCVPNPRQEGGDTMMLFDLSQDIAEQNNLADQRPDDVARLQALYEAWLAEHQPTPWGRGNRRRQNDRG